MGPHALYAKAAGAEVLRRFGVAPEGAAPSASGALALAGGGAHALPAGFVSLLATGLLDLGATIDLGRFLASLPKLDAARYDAVPVSEALRELLARPASRRLVTALVRLTSYGHAPDVMSAGAALRQLQLAFDGGVLYLHEGWQSLVDDLRAAARARGVRLETGARVRRVRRAEAGRLRVEVDRAEAREGDAVVLAVGPRDARRLVEDGDDPALARMEAQAVPVRLASLDVGLRTLPAPRRTFALGIDEPTYVSVHSAAARLAPEGMALVHACRYLAPDETPERDALRAELEATLSRLQPGWRRHIGPLHFQPALPVAHALPRADAGGLAGRPGPAVPDHPDLFVAGDWVGSRGLLADASLASGAEAGRAAAGTRARPARAA
ncbi:MAG: FAD-dependent oxidoreductase, partial [Myxococcota bacterium]|nr:FAD-dependent oxidoreductase [Myxococcota bacterium]